MDLQYLRKVSGINKLTIYGIFRERVWADKCMFHLKLISLMCVVIASALYGWSITSLATENIEILIVIGTGLMVALMFDWLYAAGNQA